MKLLKKILAVFTFLFVFTVMAVNMGVNAADSEEFSANTLTAGTTISSGAKVYDGTLFDIEMAGTGAYYTKIGGAESGKYSTESTLVATNTTDSKEYSNAVLPSSTTKDGSKGFNIKTGEKAISIIVYFTISDGNFPLSTSSVGDDYAKTGNIRIDGTVTEISGNKARTTAYKATASIPANSTVLIDASSNRIVLFGIVAEEAQVTSYDVIFMDGTDTIKESTIVSGSKITYTPVKYGYDFEGWYTESALEHKINTETYTVTDDVTLYANWTAWTNTGITTNTLSNSAIEKIATGIGGNLEDDLALTPSIYTAMSGVSMTTTSVTLPGAAGATQSPCFNTNGPVSTSGNGLKFATTTSGFLTAWIGSGGGSERNIKLTTTGTNSITPKTGSLVVGDDESARYAVHEVVFAVEAGTTYYLGGDNGVRIYYISYEADLASEATLYAGSSVGTSTVDASTSAVRFLGKIVGVAEDEITSASVTITGTASINRTVTEFYTSLNMDGAAAAEDTLYFYYSIYGLTDVYNDETITFTYTITFADGSTKTLATTYEYTIAL